uniref:Uncharacterized protein n=1 Tax=Arundo donax TaxID=35708 RepID=A0A0A9GWB6_ARUDO
MEAASERASRSNKCGGARHGAVDAAGGQARSRTSRMWRVGGHGGVWLRGAAGGDKRVERSCCLWACIMAAA